MKSTAKQEHNLNFKRNSYIPKMYVDPCPVGSTTQAFGFQFSRSENVDVADCLSCKTTKFLDEKLSFESFFVEQNFQ